MDKVKIKALLKSHCTVDGNRWVFKQVDINEAAMELEQNFCKPDVVRCKELLEQMYKDGMKADKGNDNELLALRIVISLLEVPPAL